MLDGDLLRSIGPLGDALHRMRVVPLTQVDRVLRVCCALVALVEMSRLESKQLGME